MKTRQSGFNLIELLIVIVILALLATIAMPSFQSFIRNTRLANVRSELAENAKNLERYYTQKGTFACIEPSFLTHKNKYFDISFKDHKPSTCCDSDDNTCEDEQDINPSHSGFILEAKPNKETNPNETCSIYYDDSGIFWAVNSKRNEVCPGYEEAYPNEEVKD
ncbi:type IV pilin protein [Neisseria sp. N95_16]|uniref:Prepilin-type N-terminal cleavage/methylation domain-containing protein n=1 Tax=Neisseria brasiliensis TaxID=2666100 RepID=A0A5Q3RX66_9NEIS|nr:MULTISPECIES: type IV pilin protein [Neisseria]MRN37503.1 prepilin-type N-terminal cleavage/methylation domain-containing protein [Neisseria brasiliensis]PJO08617.1 type IV pilin protein [Neisseria sp. N95_16]PJO79366.1 type IV pilin protein [Neisseria sp. N177_16]QGL24495.1 prepilin-type N-terminal cleavage/methylation domain-containing protein [Neisseria brasiliensis]